MDNFKTKKILVLYFNDYISKKFDNNFFYWHTPLDLYSDVVVPIKNVFSQVQCINYFEQFGDFGQFILNKNIVSFVKEYKPDYVFWCTQQYEIYPSTLKKIHQLGSIVIGMSFDCGTRNENFVVNWVNDVDVLFFSNLNYISHNKKIKKNSVFGFFPTASKVNYNKTNKTNKIYDVSFVGSYSEYRNELIHFLKTNGIDVHVFGYGWKNGAITHEQKLEVYNKTKINLSFETAKQEIQVRTRIFEVIISGNFLITDRPKNIYKYFVENENIVTFSSKKDLLAKIEFFLKNKKDRIKIQKQMNVFFENNYTSENVLKNMFNELFDSQIVKKSFYSPIKYMKSRYSYYCYSRTFIVRRFLIIRKSNKKEGKIHRRIFLIDTFGLIVNFPIFIILDLPIFVVKRIKHFF